MLEDHILLAKYGDDLRYLPGPMRRAHVAILQGQAEKRREKNNEAERNADRASRNANTSKYT